MLTRERKGEKKGEREPLIGCLPHVPRLGIEPTTKVPKVLLRFTELLSQNNYLSLPQVIINYIVKLSMSDSPNVEDI